MREELDAIIRTLTTLQKTVPADSGSGTDAIVYVEIESAIYGLGFAAATLLADELRAAGAGAGATESGTFDTPCAA
jgi:hypothetical protein